MLAGIFQSMCQRISSFSLTQTTSFRKKHYAISRKDNAMKTPVLFAILAMLLPGPVAVVSTAGDKKAPVTGPAVQANNDFACELYRNLSKENEGKNLFFSPYSISNALAMTLEGARGETAAEMGKVMGLPESLREVGEEGKIRPWNVGPYHQGFADLNRRLTKATDGPKVKAI